MYMSHPEEEAMYMDINALPIITELDAARIRELATRMPDGGKGPGALNELIEMVTHQADIVPSRRVSPNVVTLNSIVSFRDELTQTVHKVTLVYPQDVSIGERRISVLSPVGRALLGQAVGNSSKVELPDGGLREIRVLELHYQPEAAGEYTR
jgi:regulator of nucleoside diphosphate kinase